MTCSGNTEKCPEGRCVLACHALVWALAAMRVHQQGGVAVPNAVAGCRVSVPGRRAKASDMQLLQCSQLPRQLFRHPSLIQDNLLLDSSFTKRARGREPSMEGNKGAALAAEAEEEGVERVELAAGRHKYVCLRVSRPSKQESLLSKCSSHALEASI